MWDTNVCLFIMQLYDLNQCIIRSSFLQYEIKTNKKTNKRKTTRIFSFCFQNDKTDNGWFSDFQFLYSNQKWTKRSTSAYVRFFHLIQTP